MKPVTTEGATSVEVYFPGSSKGDGKAGLWYDVDTMAVEKGVGAYRAVEAPMDKIPVFQRGGSIIPR